MATEAVLRIARKAWVVVLAAAALGCDQAVLQPSSPATKLAFRVQPLDASANQPMTPAIEVRVQDDAGNSAQDIAGNVTVSIGDNVAGGILSGTTTQAFSHGIATFRDLTIDRSGSGYTLVASAVGLDPVTSVEFTVRCVTNCWTAKAPMPTRRTLSGIGVLDRRLYAVGGLASGARAATVEAYDPETNIWITKAPLPTPRSGLAVGVLNGILYAVGGSSSGADATGILEAYDPVTNSWTTKASMPTARSALGVAVADGHLYAIGGTAQNGQETAVVEVYDPITNTWATKAPMPAARSAFGSAVVNGAFSDVIYVFGGENAGSLSTTTEAYDPESDTWAANKAKMALLAPLPTPRSGLGAVSVNGVIYTVGGRSLQGISQTVEIYDPLSDTWTSGAPMPTERVLLTVGELDGILYAIGGSSERVPFLGTNEAYQPQQQPASQRTVTAR